MNINPDPFSKATHNTVGVERFLAHPTTHLLYQELLEQGAVSGYNVKCEIDPLYKSYLTEPHVVFVIVKDGKNVMAVHASGDSFVTESRNQDDYTQVRTLNERNSRILLRDIAEVVENPEPALTEEQLKAFQERWHLRNIEQRAAFFSSGDPALIVHVEDVFPSLVDESHMVRVKFYDPRYMSDKQLNARFPEEPGLPVLHANVFYFPETKELGIESIYVPESQRGKGHFKAFMRGMVQMGEEQEVQRLHFLAGEQSGPGVWARLGVHISDQQASVALDMQGRHFDHYANWQKAVRHMRAKIKDAVREKLLTAKDVGSYSELLGGLDNSDPLPPKDNFYKLARMKGEIGGKAPIDYLLNAREHFLPYKYNAYFDFKNSKQMSTLKHEIGLEKGPDLSPQSRSIVTQHYQM